MVDRGGNFEAGQDRGTRLNDDLCSYGGHGKKLENLDPEPQVHTHPFVVTIPQDEQCELARLPHMAMAKRRCRRKGGAFFVAMNGRDDKVQEVSLKTLKADVMPNHLLVLVHGILASPNDWKYVEGELRRQLSRNFLIYASAVNSYLQTFTGIDFAGRRLAEEVQQVVKKTPSLKRISFLAHSLGGLFARYAIAILLSSDDEDYNDEETFGLPSQKTIAGLDPVNFITLATPHLGVRGKNQLPFLLGIPFLEKLAAPIASFVVGRTGRQLFLTDGMPHKPPLLLRMSTDCEDGKFISALGSFKSLACYANVSYDHMVGWRTSSIRRKSELPKPPKKSLDGYKHVVSVICCPPVCTHEPFFQPETAQAKEAAQTSPSSDKATAYYERIEEEMIRGLQQVGWRKVDVSFHAALWPFLAHNHIHVKQEWLHYEGAGVVAHVADTFKQQEKHIFIAASL